MWDLVAALGLALVLEGAAYALFPQAVRRMFLFVMTQPEGAVRAGGLAAAVIGMLTVLLARGLP